MGGSSLYILQMREMCTLFIYLHEMGELEIIQRLVAGILDNKIVVDTNTRINSENDKISIFDLSKKK